MSDLSIEASEASLEIMTKSPEIAHFYLTRAFEGMRTQARTIAALACCMDTAKTALEAGDVAAAKEALELAEAEFKKAGGFKTQTLPGHP